MRAPMLILDKILGPAAETVNPAALSACLHMTVQIECFGTTDADETFSRRGQ